MPDRPPVVVLIFDEFPLDTLLRPDGSIDAERYPNFADLAKRSTWFPNAFTIYDSTFKAVPAIMDAVLPRKGTAADFRSHPRSVYHLFDGLGYEVVDVASGEALCPPRICPAARTTRPGRAEAARRRRAPGPAPRLDRGDPQARGADLLSPACPAAARALDLPARPGTRAGRRATTRSPPSTARWASTTRR